MRLHDFRWFAFGLIAAIVFSLLAVSAPLLAADETRVLVGFHGAPDAAVIHQAGGKVHRVFHLIRTVSASIPDQAIQGLQHNPKVEYVESDRTVQLVYTSGESVPWGIGKIGAPVVYNGGNTGKGVKVAVLDTGIDSSHPDLAPNYAGGYDFIWNDPDPDDENGHGTHVSGTVAAADNGRGVVGVGPEIRVYALKFLDAQGSGFTSDEIAGVEWAVNNGIKVLNMSFGSYSASLSEQKAMDTAYAAGVLLVAAAGNDGNTRKLYPAAYDSVIAVAATDSNNDRASFSSYYDDVELSAPGVSVYSSMPTYFVYLNLLGYASDHDYLNGTSMATPHVTGAAALVFSQNPGWTNARVRDRLDSTATDLGLSGRDPEFGYGLVNVQAACSTAPPDAGVGTIYGNVYIGKSSVTNGSITLSNSAGSTVATTRTDRSGAYSFTNIPADP
ncbi:MAG TPA: S8 family serine peptidase, partial [Armatimonadota bacterium]